ncbi:hypothetical protein FQN57_004931 [Myotisia sp. PD_48]|nr:hypothetical protein FQN57_004931 [Myotisia sp. PD_48]
MECAHCHEKFQIKAQFLAHCTEHSNIQKKLQRPATRTYGGRYGPIERKKAQTKTPATPASPPQLPKTGDREKEAQDKEVKATERASFIDKAYRDILHKFRPYEGDGVEQNTSVSQELPCPDCKFKFRTPEEREDHYRSAYCRGSHIVAYLMYMDSSKPGSYRIERLEVPFDARGKEQYHQCKKCGAKFPTIKEKDDHQATHSLQPVKCLHCKKILSSEFELDDHYDWHDDMEYRNNRGRPGDNPLDNSGGIDELPHVKELLAEYRRGPNKGRKHLDGEWIGISLISGEDMERVNAPQGIFDGHQRGLYPFLHVDPVYGIAIDIDLGPGRRVVPESDGLTLGDDSLDPSNGGQSEAQLPTTAETSKLPYFKADPQMNFIRLTGHGLPGLSLVTDVSGRLIWLPGKEFGIIVNLLLNRGPFPDEDGISAAAEGGNFEMARKLCLDGLSMVRAKPEHYDPNEELIILSEISVISTSMGCLEDAIYYTIQILNVVEKLAGKDSIETFNAINKLAVAYEAQGRFAEASCLYRRSLAGKLERLGQNDPGTLMTMQELGCVTLKLGSLLAARTLLEQAYIGFENLGEEGGETMALTILNNIASSYLAEDMHHEARHLTEYAISRVKERPVLDHKLMSLLLCNYLLSRTSPIVPQEYLDIIYQLKDSKCSERLEVWRMLGYLYERHLQFTKAVEIYKQLFEWSKSCKEEIDPPTIEVAYRVADCYRNLHSEEATHWFDLVACLSRDSTDPRTGVIHSKAVRSLSVLEARKSQFQQDEV